MKIKIPFTLFLVFIILLVSVSAIKNQEDNKIISYTIDPQKAKIGFYYKDEYGKLFKSISAVKSSIEAKGKKLKFAMNGGMYQIDNSPLGLFIQNGKTITPLNTRNAEGNFYLKPNGVFLITKNNKAIIQETSKTTDFANIKYATQSGPMLIINGKIHPAFNAKSTNLYIRNGVGILPNGKAVFAISKEPVSFYEFATYFKDLGCKNALYLDGFVSRMYCPEKNMLQTDGDFGVIMAEWE